MKKLAVLLLACLLAACAPAAAPLSTATPIPPTLTSEPTLTNTPRPTATRKPTSTHVSPKPTKTPDIKALREDFLDLVRQILEDDQTIQTVNMVRATNGMLEIEVRADYTSDDILTSISFDTTQTLARILKGLTEMQLAQLVDGEKFMLSLSVLESVGTKKAISLTDFATFKKLQDLEITQGEWQQAAGFKIER